MVKRGIGVISAVTATAVGATILGTVHHVDRPIGTIVQVPKQAPLSNQQHEHDDRSSARQPEREAVYRVTSGDSAAAQMSVSIPGYPPSVLHYWGFEYYGRILINVTSSHLMEAR